jgi:hypothetical protein
MHNLSLIFPTTSTCDLLTIQDGSCYNENFPIENTILEIRVPGTCCFISFNLLEGWCSRTFNCQDLNLCVNNTCTDFPDGNYEIKYSVDPNVQTMVEYNYFRVCQLKSNYVKILLDFFAGLCNFSKLEKEDKALELRNIEELIKASVFMAEDELDVSKAIEIYNIAAEKIKKFNDKDCPTCK